MPSKKSIRKPRAKKPKRYKILLDEGLSPRKYYSQLNNLHDVKHVKHDLGMASFKDNAIYKRALDESRIIIIFNTKHFRKLLRKNAPTIIALSTNLTNQEVDSRVCSILKKMELSETKGQLISVSKDEIKILKKI